MRGDIELMGGHILNIAQIATFPYIYHNKQIKTWEGVHCSTIEHGITLLSVQTAIQKKEAKLASFEQSENRMASYDAL